ncbi:MAG: thiamine-phosphate kinase [Aquificota bacterium]|nr:thiamine-phosphate kinase [Aquificota bacterium]
MCGGNLLLTTDLMLEGVHFLRRYPPEAVGWKAISVNVSDMVGNGGTPEWALVSLMLPDVEVSLVERIYEGIKRACDFYGCEVVGGNVSRAERIGVDVFLVGRSERAVGRGGAKPGDSLFVSGTLGDSRAGLELLKMEKESYEDFELTLIERHLRPTARIDYLRHIQKYTNASMDISDGLVADALHISKRSGVRIDIESSKLPLSEELKRFCDKYRKDPKEYALLGGEDYQLLFTHPRERWNPFLDMSEIGTLSEGEGVFVDGKAVEGGYRHF